MQAYLCSDVGMTTTDDHRARPHLKPIVCGANARGVEGVAHDLPALSYRSTCEDLRPYAGAQPRETITAQTNA